MEKNDQQRLEPKRLGGITGRGFLPGQSGNPSGRPRGSAKGLLTVLRSKIAEAGQDGRTIEERLVAALVEEALRGKHRLAAIEVIFDRLEGRPAQRLDLADVTSDLRSRSTEELQFFLDFKRWPSDAELATMDRDQKIDETARL